MEDGTDSIIESSI